MDSSLIQLTTFGLLIFFKDSEIILFASSKQRSKQRFVFIYVYDVYQGVSQPKMKNLSVCPIYSL